LAGARAALFCCSPLVEEASLKPVLSPHPQRSIELGPPERTSLTIGTGNGGGAVRRMCSGATSCVPGGALWLAADCVLPLVLLGGRVSEPIID